MSIREICSNKYKMMLKLIRFKTVTILTGRRIPELFGIMRKIKLQSVLQMLSSFTVMNFLELKKDFVLLH